MAAYQRHSTFGANHAPMRKLLFIFSFFAFFVLTSCHTAHKATARHSRTPKFIDDIYMDPHNKNCATADCIDRTSKYPEKRYLRRQSSSKNGAHTHDSVIAEAYVIKPVTRTEEKGLSKKYADLIGIGRSDINSYSLYAFVDEWYGVKYRLGGLDRSGIDCSGFAYRLYQSVYGIELLHNAGDQYANCDHIRDISKAVEGDLVFFKTHGHRISHVGVYLGNDHFVHASTSQGVMISSLKDEYWQAHLVGAGRVSRS